MNAKPKNLNSLVSPLAQENGVASSEGNTVVYFRHLEKHLIHHIMTAEIVVGCVAWVTHQSILQALAKVPQGVSIIVQKEDFLRPDLGSNGNWRAELRQRYSQLRSLSFWPDLLDIHTTAINGDQFIDPVRCVGIYNRSNAPAAPRMHHKFLVLCCLKESKVMSGDKIHVLKEIEPYAVWTGSFNLTFNAVNSLENAVLLTDPDIAKAYYREWQEVAFISEPLDWEQDWVQLEWGVT
jgi:phosphatidylserine/phosphatidylglycerophosphate/cardiolipin synthase-like enzyme